MRRKNAISGFTLIELLIVVAIIGLISAIAIPNMLNAIDRGKQKRTMADMRAIATACEEYSIDLTFYPLQSTQGPVIGVVSASLEIGFISNTPPNDGWSQPIRYGTDTGGLGYTIRSYGKNGIADASVGVTRSFNCDIIFQNGQFTAWPEGLQS